LNGVTVAAIDDDAASGVDDPPKAAVAGRFLPPAIDDGVCS
jgi:hypothetical protein